VPTVTVAQTVLPPGPDDLPAVTVPTVSVPLPALELPTGTLPLDAPKVSLP
jgi:hypothetical protein